MKRAVILGAVAAVLTSGAVWAQPAVILHGPKAATESIVEAERYYSDHVAKVGVARGMSDFIDPEDGLSFTGGDPVRGGPATFKAYGGDAPASYTLSWIPAEVFASSGGDMAASWGRFKIVAKDPKVKPVSGRYVTVWRKAADGKWKAIMDIGQPEGS